jgi:glycosyltransferase involved in cell wall biosynthesis
MLLGKKRNSMHEKCKGDIIVYMDDDDYYPPERLSHAVEMLQKNPNVLFAGSSEMHIYFNSRSQLYRCGPYKEYHATAATFAFRKELLLKTKYDDNKALAEENQFTKGYTIPLIQLDPLKSILVFSHKHNSLNKEKLLENPEQTKTVPSKYTVDDFIKDPELKKFYMYDMNNLLNEYSPGLPEHKPKLLEQLKQMEDERAKRIEEHNNMLVAQQKLLYNSKQDLVASTNIIIDSKSPTMAENLLINNPSISK